jgi:hypothetical protein
VYRPRRSDAVGALRRVIAFARMAKAKWLRAGADSQMHALEIGSNAFVGAVLLPEFLLRRRCEVSPVSLDVPRQIEQDSDERDPVLRAVEREVLRRLREEGRHRVGVPEQDMDAYDRRGPAAAPRYGRVGLSCARQARRARPAGAGFGVDGRAS